MKAAYENLGEFVQELEKAGELLRIKALVSVDLEIAHITDLASKSPGGGKALLFENVKGHSFPVLTNAFGSEKRICMALGVSDLDELGERLTRFLETRPPETFAQGLRLLPLAMELIRFFPRRFKKGQAPCQQVVLRGDKVDLRHLPVLKCWPKDGGPFITLPVVITRSLTTGRRNLGMYRMQVFDARSTGMHWHVHKDGSNYFSEYRKAGKPMPVAVAIGTDPATTYAATTPLPRGVDETILAGFIRRKPVPLVSCITIDLEVPAEAEFVLEGYVNPDELRLEGPFGDHTGYYSLPDYYPVFHVTAITHRRNPIYPATVVGRPPMEDCYLAKATERLFLPLLRVLFPEVQDYWLPWEGVFHNIAVISINKEYPGHARRIMSALWGQGQMSFCKALVIVDSSLDLKDSKNLLRSILDSVDLASDLYITEGILDVLDHSSPQPLFGSKVGIDATSRISGEVKRCFPPNFPSKGAVSPTLEDLRNKISRNITGVYAPPLEARNRPLLINIRKDEVVTVPTLAPGLFKLRELGAFTIFVFFDDSVDLRDTSFILWKMFNNVDPKRDIIRSEYRVIIDATKKGPADGHYRLWPDEIAMDVEVVERVRRRAKELSIEDLIQSSS